MTISLLIPGTVDGVAACADRLDLVDESYDHKSGFKALELREHYCPRCPIAAACLAGGMRGEDGVWGGTSRKQRSTHGAPPAWLHGRHVFHNTKEN